MNADPEIKPPSTENPAPPLPNDVWTYRGYHLEAGNFATTLVHLYRAEITRANSWRGRLDVTTNWAVISTGAAISFAFAQRETHHSVIILISILITLFLYIEARRYRYYELWSYRIRLLETDFYAAMLVPPFQPRADWSTHLAESLMHPRFPISMWEAVGRRLRRNYVWIYLILGLAWIAKLLLTGVPESLAEFVQRAAMGAISGWAVILFQLAFNGILIAIGIFTHRLQESAGEVLPRWSNISREPKETDER